MKETIEEICICFWKKVQEKHNEERAYKTGSFNDCAECNGYKKECKNYFSQKEYPIQQIVEEKR